MIKSIFLSIFIALIFFSCEFIPFKENKVEIAPPTPPSIVSHQLDFEKDTIWLYRDTSYVFSLNVGNYKLVSINAYVDDKSFFNNSAYQTNSSTFDFAAKNFTPGFHRFKLSMQTNLGNNSMEDVTGAKVYKLTKEWVLNLVTNGQYTTTTSLDNNRLKISWPDYPSSDLSTYQITKTWGNISDIPFATNKSSYTDNSYTGEAIMYTVKVINKSGKIIPWATLYKGNSYPTVALLKKPNGIFGLSWKKLPYYGGIERLEIWNVKVAEVPIKVGVVTNLADTFAIVSEMKFNEKANYQIRIFSKNAGSKFNQISMESRSIPYVGTIGNPSFGFSNFQPINKNQCLTFFEEAVARYHRDEAENIIMEEKLPLYSAWKFAVSSSGKSFVANFQKGIALGNSLDLLGSTLIPNVKIPSSYRNGDIAFTDNYLISNAFEDSAVISELPDFKIKLNIPFSSKYSQIKISSDGKFMVISNDLNTLYSLNNGNLSKIASFPIGASFFFHPDNPQKMLVWDNNQIIRKNTSDFSTISSFPLAVSNVLSADLYNGLILAYNDTQTLIVVNAETGAIIEQIPTTYDILYRYPQIFGNAIYVSGNKYILNNK